MKKFLKKRKQNEDMNLQITSMADIFIIILVFLLKSYSTSLSNISPSKEMLLPEAQAKDEMQEALKIEITANSINIDDKPIVTLSNYSFSKQDSDGNKGSRSLYAALMKERGKVVKMGDAPKKKDVAAKDSQDPKKKAQDKGDHDSTILVMADKETPFSTIKTVLTSAAQTGFVDLKLVVVEVQ
jgi:biopolymer transport protein ExbD